MQKSLGFTLIELLVVVLVIGILAAVAVPQYEKAVWKSRAVEMMTAVKALGQAQEMYYRANGNYPSRFDELDLSYTISSRAGLLVPYLDVVQRDLNDRDVGL